MDICFTAIRKGSIDSIYEGMTGADGALYCYWIALWIAL